MSKYPRFLRGYGRLRQIATRTRGVVMRKRVVAPTAEGVDSVIGASQENYMQESYILPTWLIYALRDNEFHLVRDLEKDPV
ncbi:hypothetical protein [Homoserinimonas hongtaonis]|uniref:Uncharacterized protein n=1 Tax=Homoserinimonas hongtaonis TaxID=2079791 RepID=A0A2U1T1M7_9MICO|nr:hypothetical protein [Salinibacterium hongtaonis]PWB97683.1 hypothetical protein DF220_07455 [Salinibacterium hongtaonis]